MHLLLVFVIVLAAYAYLFWCLIRGRISYRYKLGITHKTVVIDRDDRPLFFWGLWIGSLASITTGVITFAFNYA